MHRNRNLVTLLIGISLILFSTLSASDNSGLTFLKLPVDARSAAMGEASTALSGDAAATFRNPALLSAAPMRSLVLMHNAYLADIAQEFAAFQFLVGRHSAAISLNLMNIPGIEIRGTRPTAEPEGKTEAINFAFGLSYAYRYDLNWSFGVTAKYLFEKYYMASATGLALDFGLLRQNTFLKGLNWALAVQNLGRMQKLKTRRTPLPVILRSGLQYGLRTGFSVMQKIIFVADVNYLLNQSTQARFGVEAPLAQIIYLRAGSIFSSDKIRFSAGFGLNYKDFQVNYAFSPYPYNLGNSHRFSLSWRF